MDIYNSLKDALDVARRAKDSSRVYAYSYLLAQIEAVKIELKDKFTDGDAAAVLQKELKEIGRTKSDYERLGGDTNSTAYTQLCFEERICTELLPRQLTFDEVYEIICAQEYHEKYLNKGMIIKKIKPIVNGRVDGKVMADAAMHFIEVNGTCFYDESKDPKAAAKKARAERKAAKRGKK